MSKEHNAVYRIECIKYGFFWQATFLARFSNYQEDEYTNYSE